LDRYDRICRLIAANERGLSMRDLGHAHALARELERDPDLARLAELCKVLNIDLGAVE
jgi:hypothetical protein